MKTLASNIENPCIFANVHTVSQDPYDVSESNDIPSVGNKLLTAVVNDNDLIAPIEIESVKHIFKANIQYRARYAAYFDNNNDTNGSTVITSQQDTEAATTFRYIIMPNADNHSSSWDTTTTSDESKKYKCTNVAFYDKTRPADFPKYKAFNLVTTNSPTTVNSITAGAALVIKVNKQALKNVQFKFGIKCSKNVIDWTSTTEENTNVSYGSYSHYCEHFGATSEFVELCNGESLMNSENVKQLADDIFLIRATANVSNTLPITVQTGNLYAKFAMLPTPIIKFNTTSDVIPNAGGTYYSFQFDQLPYWNVDWLYAFNI